MSTRMTFLLVPFLLSMSWNALAQVSASAQVNGIAYELVDLDPNDGITPWATLELIDVNGKVTVFGTNGAILDECGITSAGSCSAAALDGKGTAWFDGMRSGVSTTWDGSAFGGVMASGMAHFRYSVSPHTGMSFMMSNAIGETPLDGYAADGRNFFFSNYEHGNPSEDSGRFFFDEDRIGDTTSTVYIISRNQPIYGELSVYTDATVSHSAPPVPEPSTWAMLSVGLVVLGGAKARSRGGASGRAG